MIKAGRRPLEGPLTNNMPPIAASSRLRRLQVLFTGFCVMSIALNFLDRATISVATVNVRHDFGLSATDIGGILSVWSLSYAFGQLPAGFLVDRLGPRILAGLGMLLWSIFQGLGGVATSYTQLLWLRGGLGVAEAPTGPSNAKVVSTWFPASKRGLPTGIYVAGTALGPAFAPPLLTVLMVGYGWRTMFIIMGVVGVILSLCWFLFYRSVGTARLSRDDRAYVGDDRQDIKSTITLARWSRLFRSPSVLGIIFGSCAQGFVVWIYGGWLPAMLESQYHESIQRTGILAALPWVGGVVGALSGGYIADFLLRRGFGNINSKKIPIVCGLIGLSLFTGLAGLSGSVVFVEAFAFLALLSATMATTVMWTAATIFVPPDYVASMGAIINFSGFIGATVSPILTGYTVDVTGSFDLALLIGSGVGVIGAAVMALMIRHPVSAVSLADPFAKLVDQTCP
jgi:MFS family permease